MQVKLRKVVEVTCKDLTQEIENILIKKGLLKEDEFLVSNTVQSTLEFEVKSNSPVKI